MAGGGCSLLCCRFVNIDELSEPMANLAKEILCLKKIFHLYNYTSSRLDNVHGLQGA